MTKTVEIEPIVKPITAASGACLVHIHPPGPGMGRAYPLLEEKTMVGRDTNCDVLAPDLSVSRHHAVVLRKEDTYHVKDQDSTNGTFVNDLPVREALLHDSDYVRFGSCIFRFLFSDNVETYYYQNIYQLTVTDGLTEIPNKRYFEEFLDRELIRVVRHKRPLALIMFDIDHFKEVNDRRSHLCGDFVLAKLTACVREMIRADELFARYGGEEFAVVLPETEIDGATKVAERIRLAVQDHPFTCNGEEFSVTVSVGVAALSEAREEIRDDLVQRADACLYEAKRLGRNRVIAEE